ncbi:helix-turn-helix domain-containing protein [Micromonospora sp. NPDC048830]|uniref:helix-turn-helix domain-containing protein n=1 Tax=Micromonospora sp. NPDC048830 TaxID=3364257 RepID=UPI003717D485
MYPTPEQAVVLNRTFGCVRVVWNRTLAARHGIRAISPATAASPPPTPGRPSECVTAI